jgi:hypothetical protein
MNNDIFILILEALIYGFCFATLGVYFLGFFKSQKLKKKINTFHNESIRIIRIVALLYLIYTTYYFIQFYDYSVVENRATGPYALPYWIMVLRPFNVVILIQLLWIKRLKTIGLINFLLVLILFLFLFFNGANLERYVIIITSLHRDYGTPNFAVIDPIWHKVPFLVLVIVIERIIIYSVLVLSSLFISKKYAQMKNKN